MKTIQYILLAVAMMFATTSFAQISSDNDSKLGGTYLVFETGVSIGTSDFIEVTLKWERTNGQTVTPTPAQYYFYNSIPIGTQLEFKNLTPFYDIAKTCVSMRIYKNGSVTSGIDRCFTGYLSVIPYTRAWSPYWWAVGIVLPPVD